MARTTVPFALILFSVGCATPTSPVEQQPEVRTLANTELTTDTLVDHHAHAWNTLPHEPSTLVFDNGDTLRTGLPEVHLITKFQNPLGRAWFVFSGRKSASKEAEWSLFVLSPGDSSATRAIDQPWHMPGRLMAPKDTVGYYDAEVFTGEVLRDTIGVIWYERYLLPDGTWRLNTTLLNLSDPQPDTLVLFGHGRKSSTINLAFRGKCQMLDSIDQRLEP
ncbi:MAG: hypothetical protein ABIQ75_07115 [Flavobacteriales bacterium]